MKKLQAEPKDLKLKIGSPEQALWTKVRDQLKAEQKQLKEQLKVNSEFLVKAEEMLAIEEKKQNI